MQSPGLIIIGKEMLEMFLNILKTSKRSTVVTYYTIHLMILMIIIKTPTILQSVNKVWK